MILFNACNIWQLNSGEIVPLHNEEEELFHQFASLSALKPRRPSIRGSVVNGSLTPFPPDVRNSYDGTRPVIMINRELKLSASISSLAPLNQHKTWISKWATSPALPLEHARKSPQSISQSSFNDLCASVSKARTDRASPNAPDEPASLPTPTPRAMRLATPLTQMGGAPLSLGAPKTLEPTLLRRQRSP